MSDPKILASSLAIPCVTVCSTLQLLINRTHAGGSMGMQVSDMGTQQNKNKKEHPKKPQKSTALGTQRTT